MPAPACSTRFLLVHVVMTRRRRNRRARSGGRRRGKSRSRKRSEEAVQRRAARRRAALREKLGALVGRRACHRVLLRNGVRLYVAYGVPEDPGERDDFLGAAAMDIAKRVRGQATRRTTAVGDPGVKPGGRHTCGGMWDVVAGSRGGQRVVVSLTDWNGGRRTPVPYLWVQGSYPLVVRIAGHFRPLV